VRRLAALTLPLLLALAMFARMLVPTGWMPAEGGGFAFVPCPSAGPVAAPTAAMHHGGASQHAPGHDSGKAATDCAFAPLLAGGTLPPPTMLPAPPALAAAAPPALLLSPMRAGASHGLPPATGPPART